MCDFPTQSFQQCVFNAQLLNIFPFHIVARKFCSLVWGVRPSSVGQRSKKNNKLALFVDSSALVQGLLLRLNLDKYVQMACSYVVGHAKYYFGGARFQTDRVETVLFTLSVFNIYFI